jgi:HJR/Mrr/RecB family endonuclease
LNLIIPHTKNFESTMNNDMTNAERVPLIIFGTLGALLFFFEEYGLGFIIIIIGMVVLGIVSKSKKKSSSNIDHRINNTPIQNNDLSNKQTTKSVTITDEDWANKLQRFEWRDMELIVESLFEKKGYTAEATQATADFGIDVEAKNDREYVGIQVKHWTNNVGYEDVAKTLGSSSKFNKFIIISTRSGFTPQAIKRAEEDKYKIELWDFNKFKEEMLQTFKK